MSITNTERLKIVCCNTTNYEQVTNIFKQSLFPLISEQKIELLEKTVDVTEFNNIFGFGTLSFRHLVVSKLEHALFTLENNAKENEYIVVCDTDIQFLNPYGLLKLVENAKSENFDFYAAKNNKSIYNAGFYIIRNTLNFRTFYKTFIEITKKNNERLVDQLILNRCLYNKQHSIKHNRIPSEYVILGLKKIFTKNVIFHHAVGCSNTRQKIKQMKTVKALFNKKYNLTF